MTAPDRIQITHRPKTMTTPAPEVDPSHIDQLAAIIRKVDGNNSMGAAALAEAILERYPLAFLVDPPAAAPAPGENPATPPAPELLEANFRAWYKEARGSLYCGAIPLCDAIEWAQHLLQQATPQALVPPAAPANPTPAPAMTCQQQAVVDVLDERRRQDAMWGVSNHDPTTWMAILTEAVGKTAQATVEQHSNRPPDIKARLRIKAVHVAAVALAFIECLDRSQQPAIPLPDHIAKRDDQPTAEDQP